MKILVIPDVHGRTFWRIAKEQIDDFDRIIFLGDYLDPYDDEQPPVNQCDTVAIFEEIIDFARANEKVTLLFGNHDLSYLMEGIYKCRHIWDFHDDIRHMFLENIDLFKIGTYETIDDKTYVFTHAGIMKPWADIAMGHSSPNESLIDYLNDHFHSNPDEIEVALSYVGKMRGGFGYMASPVWADIREHFIEEEYAFPENYIQIVGHTRLAKDYINIENRVICIDSRQPFIIDNEGVKTIDNKIVEVNANKNNGLH